MALSDYLNTITQMQTLGGTQPLQSPIGQPPVTDNKSKNLAIMLYALGGALRGKSPIESGLGLSQALQKQDLLAKEEERSKRIRESAAEHIRNIGGTEAQIKLAEDDTKFATEVISKQISDTNQTALIENANYLSKLREDYENETDPVKKDQLLINIRDFERLGGTLRYDPNLKFSLEQAKTAAEQGLDLGEKPLGAGELATDQAFGKFYSEYIQKGRGATNIANLERLKDAEQLLKIADQNDVDISGVTQGMIAGYPTLEAFFNPQGLITRERMESVIQQSLRATLGAQFGEREGAEFIRRGYNPSLSPAENLERLIDLRASTEQLIESEKEATEYWEENKTLRGYKGKIYNIDSFSRDLETDYKRDVVGLNNEDLEEAYKASLEGSLWEKALEKEIQRRSRLGK